MHTMYAIDLVRQRDEQFETRVARNARHLAALRAACLRAPGLRGMLGACRAAAGRDR